MKLRDFQPYIRRLLLEFGGFAANRNLVIAQPVERILRGFCFGRSMDKTAFYVNVFAQPLYAPFQAIDLSLGGRLQPWSWSSTDGGATDEIVALARTKGLPVVEAARSPGELADWIAIQYPGPKSSCVQQPYAYSLAAAHRFNEAVVELERLRDLLGKAQRKVDWEVEMAAQAEELMGAIRNGPNDADRLLAQWEEITLSHLAEEYGRLR